MAAKEASAGVSVHAWVRQGMHGVCVCTISMGMCAPALHVSVHAHLHAQVSFLFCRMDSSESF